MARLSALILCVWTLFAGFATAQDSVEFVAWDLLVEQTRQTLETDGVSEETLERLRNRLVEQRARFIDGESINTTEIETLEAQLQSLGPQPVDGEAEADDVAARRAELTESLAIARAPRLRVEEARAAADALIGQIDAQLRDRQATALFELQRSPLDPSLWQPAMAAVVQVTSDMRAEAAERVTFGAGEGQFAERLPVIVVLLVIALLLVSRGPGWTERLIRRVEARSGENGQVFWGFVVSLAAVLVPALSLSALVGALISAGVLGETGQTAALAIYVAIILYLVGRWLGNRMFPERATLPSPFRLNDEQRAKGRFLSKMTGALFGVLVVMLRVGEVEGIAPEALSVLTLPFYVALGFIFVRLGRLMVAESDDADEDTRTYVERLERLVGRALVILGFVGPLMALIGYHNMATAMLAPAAASLALIGFLAALHFAIRAAHGMLTGRSAEESAETLLPVLVTFSLTLLCLPIFALFWGARQTDLLEIWTRFRAGFRIGDATLSPGDFLTFALVFAIGYALTRLLQGTLRTTVLPRTRLDTGGRNAIVAGLGYVGLTLAALIAITAAGIDLSSFAIVVGALGVGIGFGLQNIVNNFVSGIILLVERPISEGDWVEVNGQLGTVRAISVRSTRIETFDRTDVIVPNGDFISGTVTNWTRGNSTGRVIVPVGVAYGTDTRKVEKILKEIAEAHAAVASIPPPLVLFMGFGADSLDFEIRAILNDVTQIVLVKSDLNHEIARRFTEEGIEIPFAQRDIWLRNPEALRAGDAETGGASTG